MFGERKSVKKDGFVTVSGDYMVTIEYEGSNGKPKIFVTPGAYNQAIGRYHEEWGVEEELVVSWIEYPETYQGE